MDIISVLTYFGFTPANVTPLIVVAAIGMYCVFQHTKPIKDSIESIKTNLTAVKINLTAVTTFLSTLHPTSFPSSILTKMSPYQIQSEGKRIIEESGLITILDQSENLSKIFSFIDAQNPKTRLDVERLSFISFNANQTDNIFNPVKTYLYNHPDAREFYPYLAGVYIRDKYLSKHPEIIQ